MTKFAEGTVGLYINNNGVVSGAAALVGNKAFHAFMWTGDAGMKDLGTLPGDVSSGGLAVNQRNEVVGASNSPKGDQRAFLWRNGLMADLNGLVPKDSPLYLVTAFGINDRGEIVGFGATKSGDLHAFLATPGTEFMPASALGGAQRPPDASFSKAARQTRKALGGK